MSDTIFIDGLTIYPPRENAPEFIKGSLYVADADKLIAFLKQYKDDKNQLRIDIKKSKAGKLYLALNTYKGDK